MVLPPSAPDDAPRPAEGAWLEGIKLALSLNRAGLLLLVDHARTERLGDLVRALLPEYPALGVHADVRRAASAPAGSTLVLVPRAEDAEWLNLNRPLFALQQLRVVLFCEREVSVALARQAVDFFDWISHREECPGGPPRYAVEGLRCAVAARAPGVVWRGGDLDASFAAARPGRRLRRLSAALSYPEMLEQVRAARRDWIAWTDVDSDLRLWRVRWALIEAGRRGRTVMVEPAAPSPGWWTAHARVMGVREAVEKLETKGARNPERLAALVDFEPEPVELLGEFLSAGEQALETELMQARDPGARLARMAKEHGLPRTQGERAPFVLRAFGLEQKTFKTGQALTDEIRQMIDRGEQPREAAEVLLRWFLRIDPKKLESQVKEYTAAMFTLTRALEMQGRYPEAEVLLRRVLANEAQALGTEHRDYGATLYSLSGVLFSQGKYSQAETFLRQALGIFEKTIGVAHAFYGLSLQRLAHILEAQAKFREEEPLLRQALAIQEKALGVEHPAYVASLRALAVCLTHQSKYLEAESLLRQSLSTLEKSLGIEHPSYGAALEQLADLLRAQGKSSEAEPLLRQFVALEEKLLGVEHPDYGAALQALAIVLEARGKYPEAESLLRQSLAIFEKTLGVSHPRYGASLYELANILQRQRRYPEAELLLRQAISIFRAAHGVAHPNYAGALNDLAAILRDQGRYPEAEAVLRQSIAIAEEVIGVNHPDYAAVKAHLGAVLASQGRAAEGQQHVAQALKIVQKSHDARHPATVQILATLAEIQEAAGNTEAPDTAREALDGIEHAFSPEHPIRQRWESVLRPIAQRGEK